MAFAAAADRIGRGEIKARIGTEMNDPTPFSLQLGAVDAFDIPLVVLDHEFKPLFLSSSAARVLEIRNRSQLDTHGRLLEPLIELARSAKTHTEKSSYLSEAHPIVSQLTLLTADQRRTIALAYPRPIRLNRDGANQQAHVVIFYSLHTLEPFLQIIDQTRRIRSLTIHAASQLPEQLHVDSPLGEAAEEDGPATTDLAQVLTMALNIVDKLIADSIKIVLDVKTSALLDVPQTQLIRILSHLLLEGADFAGPGGIVKVRCALDPAEQRMSRDSSMNGHVAELVIIAERSAALMQQTGPLEQYISHLCSPHSYRLSVREPEQGTKQLPLQGIVPRGRRDSMKNGAVAPEALSENLRFAHALATREQIRLEVRSLRSDLLALHGQIRLSSRVQ